MRSWRKPIAIVLIVLGAITAVPATTLAWTQKQLTETDTYVETIAPLIDDPTIQQEFADKITNAIFDNVDVQAFIDAGVDALRDAGLPERIVQLLDGLVEPLEGAVRGWVNREVVKAIASEWAARLWREINTVAHEELVPALRGDQTGTLRIQGDRLVISTGPLSRQVKERLVSSGLGIASLLPTIDYEKEILRSPQIARTQDTYQTLILLGVMLPWLAVLLIAGGILLAVDRRGALVVAGLGVAIAMAVLAVAFRVGRYFFVEAIPSDVLSSAAATDTAEIVLRSVWRPIWFLFALSALVALVAYLAGPSRTAVTMREKSSQLLVRGRDVVAKRGWSLAPVDGWVRQWQTPLLVGLAGVAALVFLLWNQPTWGVVVGVAIVVGILALMIAFVAASPSASPSQPPSASPSSRTHS